MDHQNDLQPNMDVISQIESSGGTDTRDSSAGARGKFQVTPVALKEWNQHNLDEQLSFADLKDNASNLKVASWYFNRIADHYIPHYGLEPTMDNVLAMYNYGPHAVALAKGDLSKMPEETQNYIQKYKELSASQVSPTPLGPTLAVEAAPVKPKSGRVI